MYLRAEARAFLAEHQHTVSWKFVCLQRDRIGENIYPQDGQPLPFGPDHEFIHGGMVAYMLVTIGHHSTSAIPASAANDMDLLGQKRVCRAHHCADIHVVLPVLNSDMKIVAALVEIRNDRVHQPVAVLVGDVAPISLGQQLRVIVRLRRQFTLPRANADDVLRCWICRGFLRFFVHPLRVVVRRGVHVHGTHGNCCVGF